MSKPKKERLDLLLCQLGIAESRQKAQALILSGNVLVNNELIDKVGTQVFVDAGVRLRSAPSRFVGRGGDKIDGAFDHFHIKLDNLIALDVGSSTGGFTDCMLQRGVEKVYAVDVGTNQLDFRLRQDPRVVVMEQTNVKHLTPEMFDPRPSFVSIDVSFIGVRKILPYVRSVMSDASGYLILVKPQFELGREYVSKGGVVPDPKLQHLAVEMVQQSLIDMGFAFVGYMPSPLRGGKKGNQEYFLFANAT